MLATGDTLGHYEIVAPLGTGGMGSVFRARDRVLGRAVAIKVLAGFGRDIATRRVLREAQAASALNHPNICTIHEVAEAAGTPYMVMEVIEGQPLEALIPTGGLPIERAIDYALQIAGALAHAHSRGVVHGDLKAPNVMITTDGRAKVLDFGLARRISSDDPAADATMHAVIERDEGVFGTVPYMAPELLHGEEIDVRSDIWALGVLLYRMCTKEFPFAGATHGETMAMVLRDPPRPLTADVPRSLRTAILRCL
jgi:serine/threonine protein kinase